MVGKRGLGFKEVGCLPGPAFTGSAGVRVLDDVAVGGLTSVRVWGRCMVPWWCRLGSRLQSTRPGLAQVWALTRGFDNDVGRESGKNVRVVVKPTMSSLGRSRCHRARCIIVWPFASLLGCSHCHRARCVVVWLCCRSVIPGCGLEVSGGGGQGKGERKRATTEVVARFA